MPAVTLQIARPAIALLAGRATDDATGSVPSSYGAQNSSPHPGVVAGIVLGSIAGFLMVIFVVYTCLNIAPPVGHEGASTYMGGSSVLTLGTVGRRRRGHGSPSSRRSRSGVRVRETVEVRMRDGGEGRRHTSRGPGPIIVDAEPPESDSEIYVERRRRRTREAPRTVSTVSDDDEIVVVEEDLLPPRRSSRRAESRRSSAYDEDRRYSRRGDY